MSMGINPDIKDSKFVTQGQGTRELRCLSKVLHFQTLHLISISVVVFLSYIFA